MCWQLSSKWKSSSRSSSTSACSSTNKPTKTCSTGSTPASLAKRSNCRWGRSLCPPHPIARDANRSHLSHHWLRTCSLNLKRLTVNRSHLYLRPFCSRQTNSRAELHKSRSVRACRKWSAHRSMKNLLELQSRREWVKARSRPPIVVRTQWKLNPNALRESHRSSQVQSS